LPAAAVRNVVRAAEKASEKFDVDDMTGVRAVRLQTDATGAKVAVPFEPRLYEPPAKPYEEAFDIVHGGRTYSAYVVQAPGGGDYELIDELRAVEHLRYVMPNGSGVWNNGMTSYIASVLQLEAEAARC
jgi:hypothetical protein